MKKRSEEIDILKGIAIVLVIFGHSFIKYPINICEMKFWSTLYEFIRGVHMPLFFIVSGYCYSKKGGYKEYINKKIWRILIPYLVFNLIELIPRIFAKQFINGNNSIAELLFNFAFRGGTLWFLYTLMEIFIIFPLFEKIYNRDNKYIKVFLLILTIGLSFLDSNIFIVDSFCTYIVYFYFGFIMKKNKENKIIVKISEQLKKWYIIILQCIAYVGLIYVNITLKLKIIELIAAFIGISICFGIAYNIKHKVREILIDCGKYSLQLYLLNGYILAIARILIVKILKITNPFFIVSLIFLIILISGMLIIKKIMIKSKFISKLSGIVE